MYFKANESVSVFIWQQFDNKISQHWQMWNFNVSRQGSHCVGIYHTV